MIDNPEVVCLKAPHGDIMEIRVVDLLLLEFTCFFNLDVHRIWQRNELQFEATLAGVATVRIMIMLTVLIIVYGIL